MQHKWHKEIKAWADGEEIEAKWNVTQSGWFVDPIPRWNNDEWEYRIKSQPKEPKYLYVWLDKDTELAQLETHEPKGVLEDDLYKYIGKIKLEVDDE
jgi:phosphoribosylaminoimidazole (AIR) synthetase